MRMDREGWTLDSSERIYAYAHDVCEIMTENDACPKCGAFSPARFTWSDVWAFALLNGFDQEEYFKPDLSYFRYDAPKDPESYYHRGRLNERVWRDDVAHVACFWEAGTNEGWFVHVGLIFKSQGRSGPTYADRMLGKFMSMESAEEATSTLNHFLNERIWYGTLWREKIFGGRTPERVRDDLLEARMKG